MVTCSGGRNTGSLNVIRAGSDFEELATIEGIDNVTNVWPIRNYFKDEYVHQMLLPLVANAPDLHF